MAYGKATIRIIRPSYRSCHTLAYSQVSGIMCGRLGFIKKESLSYEGTMDEMYGMKEMDESARQASKKTSRCQSGHRLVWR